MHPEPSVLSIITHKSSFYMKTSVKPFKEERISYDSESTNENQVLQYTPPKPSPKHENYKWGYYALLIR